MMNNNKVEQIYQEFWKDIICDDNGNVDVEQVKKELCDFYKIIQEVPKVYCEVTGGRLSKPLYDAETVLCLFREKHADKTFAVDCLYNDWGWITRNCNTNEEYRNAIFEYFAIDGDK